MIEMHYVESSNIEAIGYDVDRRQLHVRFLKTGATYVYDDVDEWVFNEFLQSESKGRYFNQNIREAYSFGRL